MVVDVVGQRVLIDGRFHLSDQQRNGIPKTGRQYDLEGNLTTLQSTREPPTAEQWHWLVRYFPYNEERINILAKEILMYQAII